jgi:predicted dehydrogenase
MGTTRADACRRLAAEVAAVVDPDLAAARELAANWPGARVEPSLDRLDWEELDAVFICTPPTSHVDAAAAATRTGTPFLVEKPLAPSAPAADELVRAVRERGLLSAVGYMNRYRQSVARLRERVELSPIFAISCAWVARPYAKPWWTEPATGGALNDYATHLVDLCRFLAGEVAEVAAFGSSDRSAAILQFETGVCAALVTSSRGTGRHVAVDVFHAGGEERLEGWDLRPSLDPESSSEDIFTRETRWFLGALSGARSSWPLSDVEDAQRTQRVVDAIARSAATGRAQKP